MSVILKAENISKQYRLGTVGTGTLSHDLNRWWHQVRGKEDPYLKVGATNDRSAKATEDYVWALRDINFEVKQGEVLGIIGKNGAGKSTLLKLLSRVTAPTTGSIKTKGRIASLLEVGTGFHGELTGRENIFMNGAVLGMSRAEIKSKLDEIIAFSGCEKYIDTPVKRYSSGMTVRLGFAVAAHLEPEILVVDEVLAVGDAEFQKKAIGKMQDLSAGEGRTVLFVSHNMLSVQNLCGRGMVLENGKTAFLGAIEEAVENYLETKNRGNLSFADREKKIGILQVDFVDKHYKSIRNIKVGQEVRVVLRYRNPESHRTSLSMAFYDSQEKFLFGCRSDVVNKIYSQEEGEGVLIIKKWPLSAGVYSYNTGMLDPNRMIENLQDVGTILVEDGDYFGSGKLPAAAKKGFYIDHSWI